MAEKKQQQPKSSQTTNQPLLFLPNAATRKCVCRAGLGRKGPEMETVPVRHFSAGNFIKLMGRIIKSLVGYAIQYEDYLVG